MSEAPEKIFLWSPMKNDGLKNAIWVNAKEHDRPASGIDYIRADKVEEMMKERRHHCEWEKQKDTVFNLKHTTSCGHSCIGWSSGWVYCNWCGGRIVETEKMPPETE